MHIYLKNNAVPPNFIAIRRNDGDLGFLERVAPTRTNEQKEQNKKKNTMAAL